jgi:hypothetical protein
MSYPVHLWNAGITSITVERVADAVSGQYGECSFMGGYTIMGPNQHGDCWIRKEVTAADFEAHHWEGRLLVVNATVVTSAMDGNGTLTEDPVTASAAFDLPYNADIQYRCGTVASLSSSAVSGRHLDAAVLQGRHGGCRPVGVGDTAAWLLQSVWLCERQFVQSSLACVQVAVAKFVVLRRLGVCCNALAQACLSSSRPVGAAALPLSCAFWLATADEYQVPWSGTYWVLVQGPPLAAVALHSSKCNLKGLCEVRWTDKQTVHW